MNRWWELVDANTSIALLTAGASRALLEPPVNVLRLSLHPDGMAGADQARLLWEQSSEIVVSRLAWTEAMAALAAARRGRQLTGEGYAEAVEVFRECFARCTVASVADRLVEQAAELAADYDLRAADAIHLATGLAVTEPDSVFVTWDKRLQQAAIQAGLVTAPAGS